MISFALHDTALKMIASVQHALFALHAEAAALKEIANVQHAFFALHAKAAALKEIGFQHVASCLQRL